MSLPLAVLVGCPDLGNSCMIAPDRACSRSLTCVIILFTFPFQFARGSAFWPGLLDTFVNDTQRTLLLGSVVVASTELLFPRDTMHATSISMMEQPPRPGWNDDRAPLLIGVTAGCLTLTLVFVVLRFYVRAIVIRKWGPDDSLVVISYVYFVPSPT